ncbi:hypothetical protein CERSUDRAFT_59087, partial [Gelatoporia subvermispora B]
MWAASAAPAAAWHVGADVSPSDDNPGDEIFAGLSDISTPTPPYSRLTDPFHADRVRAILQAVRIGPDLTSDERRHVIDLLSEFADCFALSVSEVFPVPGAVHKLHIPPGTSFGHRVHQRPLTPPQRDFLHRKIDELLAAGVIEACTPDQVKCVSPMTLAQKAH